MSILKQIATLTRRLILKLVGHPEKVGKLKAGKLAWHRPSSLNEEPARQVDGTENPILKRIRDIELRSKAPFSDQVIIVDSADYVNHFELPAGWNTVPGTTVRRGDVPICKIAGAHGLGNMGNVVGMTYREALFNHLSANGWTDESFEFMRGGENKDKPPPVDHKGGTLDGPRKPVGPLKFQRYGDWYVEENGTHRTILAMYSIWQRYGEAGLIRNVQIRDYPQGENA